MLIRSISSRPLRVVVPVAKRRYTSTTSGQRIFEVGFAGAVGGVVGATVTALFFARVKEPPKIENVFTAPKFPRRIILVRHGESEGNADKVISFPCGRPSQCIQLSPKSRSDIIPDKGG